MNNRERWTIPGLDTVAGDTKSELFKQAIEKLSVKEKAAITAVYRKFIENAIADRTKQYRDVAHEALHEKSMLENKVREYADYDKYYAFYAVLSEQPLYRSSMNGEVTKSTYFLDGLEEAINYLKKPSQVVQHLQDPNPKSKDVNINYRNRS